MPREIRVSFILLEWNSNVSDKKKNGDDRFIFFLSFLPSFSFVDFLFFFSNEESLKIYNNVTM